MRCARIILHAFILLCSLLPLKVLSNSLEKYQFYVYSLFSDRTAKFNNGNSLASRLGEGWSSDNDAPVGQCLSGKVEYVGTPSALLSFDLLNNYKNVLEELNISVNGKVGLAAFQFRAVTDYTHMLEDSAYTQTFIYRAIVKLKSRHFVPPVDKSPLTWIGRQYAQDPIMFRANCGDKFVSEQQLGGLLYVAVKFKFHTEQEKLKFNTSINGHVTSLLKLDENLSKAARSVRHDGDISVMALQIGGDPTKLGHILGTKPGATSVPVLSCTLANLRDCHNAIHEIAVYASDSSKGNFPDQFKIDDSQSLIGPAVLKNILQNMTTVVPVKMGPSLVTPAICDAREKLLHDYESAVEQGLHIRELFSQHIPLSASYTQRLHTLRFNVENNINLLRKAGLSCYRGDLSKCLSEKILAEGKLLPVDTRVFEKRISVLGVHQDFLFPYDDNQYIFGSRGVSGRSQVYSVKTFTKFKLDLENATEYFIGTSNNGGLSYRGYFFNKLTRYSEYMTFIPDFKAEKQPL